MNAINITLNLMATVGFATSLVLFLTWLTETFERSYRIGESMGKASETTGDFLPGALSLLSRLITALLPFADDLGRWRFLGLDGVVRRWDKDLLRAGWRSRISGIEFVALIMSCCLSLFVLFTLLLILFGVNFVVALLIGATLGAVPACLLPAALQGEIKNRVSLIEKRLPFAIEFMLLALEARAAFPAAVEVYCSQMGSDPLADEFSLALAEMREGLSIEDALLALGRRVDSEDLSAFVLAATTGISTGQPLQEVMQVQANVARQRRFQAAERIAKTASTRATFPLFLAVFGVLLLLIGPLIIRVAQHSLF